MLVVTTLAGAATGLGAIPLLFRQSISHRTYDAALGLAAGIMTGASVFGLLLPGLETGTLLQVTLGVVAGTGTLLVGNRLLPHVHARYRGWRHHGQPEDLDLDLASRLRRAVLIGGAIVLHNVPEGLAIGVAFAAGLEEVALFLAVVIGLQNVPDGFAFAVPVAETGLSRSLLVIYTTLSGLLPQVLAALVGFGLVAIATDAFPVAAGFAAGAMLGVVSREMVPSSHGHGHADAATATFVLGVLVILLAEELLVT